MASPTTSPTTAPSTDVAADTWVATDALGRTLPGLAEAGPARAGKFVGIFYFLWMEDRPGLKLFDISKILDANPANPQWGPPGAFHWWGEPQLGYYRSNDDFVIRKHAQMLTDAGVDVVFFDVTNALTYDTTYLAICRVYEQMRREGAKTPQIAFLAHTEEAKVVTKLYETFYSRGLHSGLWFQWKGKPLILASEIELEERVRSFFTFRKSWAWSEPKGWFGDGINKWPWLDHYPQRAGWNESPDKPEQVSVSVAQHPVTNIGRSFSNGKQPVPEACQTDVGLCFAEQWKRALEIDPEFVFITGWNEWIAQRFVAGAKGAPPAAHMLGKELKAGDTFFVDAYSREFSRDIEPMRGGHGDNYYYQMVANIRRFKGVRPPEPASAVKTITIDANFTQWENVGPTYRDDPFDTAHRDAVGYGDAGKLVNVSGRNDLAVAKVARDAASVYFYVRTREPLTASQGANWMTLLIDADSDPKTGWNGYDLAVNRSRGADGQCSIERWSADGKWQSAGSARYASANNALHLSFARSLLGAAGKLALNFKWADNDAIGGDISDFIDQGDVAPNGRFSYRFAE